MLDDDGEEETGEATPRKDGGDEEGESLLRRLKRWESLARNHWSAWRDEAKQCYDFVAGHQWTSDDKAALLDQMRQPVTFNRVAPMVDAVTGAEILNRQEVRYLPREQGDVQVNELITAADEWAREQADTEDEESDAFADVVICGMGWSETRMDYAEDPEGRIVDDRIDPLEMWSDPAAKKRCLADARFIVRARWRDKGDLPKAWKRKVAATTEGNAGSIDEVQSGWTGPKDDYDRDEEPGAKEPKDADKRRVWIRHIQWWDKVPIWRVADPMTGKVVTVDKAQLKRLGMMFMSKGMRPPQAIKGEQNKYFQAFIAGNTILETGPIEANAFTFKCITGKRDRNSNTFYGAVRAMVDPQMWGNKFFTQIMHILNTSAKGGLLYEEDSFTDPRKALEDWAKPDAAIGLKRGALSGPAPKVQERLPRNYPQGLDRIMEFSLNNLPQTSGISLEMLGLVEREQAGVLEMQRKKAGYAILAVFFDSLRRYRKTKGRLRLFYIQNYISDGRLIRIKGKDATMQYVPLLREKDVGAYDVMVDEAPMSPNQKEAVWGMLTQMLPLLSQLNVPPDVWSTILEYSPLPSSVSGKINQSLAKQAGEPPPPDPEMVKVQARLEADKQKLQLEAQHAQAMLQMKAQEHAMSMERKKLELGLEAQKAELELRAKQVDLAEAAARQLARQGPGVDLAMAAGIADAQRAGVPQTPPP